MDRGEDVRQKHLSLFRFFIGWCCVKVLLIPSYRSTDFDVHRNWLATTKHLSIQEWYYYDQDTVHTLDYPPLFAFFEYLISNNPITEWLLSQGVVDERCFALLPDIDNTPSLECVYFHRSTVILSDILLWSGAHVACRGMFGDTQRTRVSFLLMVLNPGLLWLDHIHFQYNGMLLGLLLFSLGCLLHGNTPKLSLGQFHVYHLSAAVSFAMLIALKHLYLPLAPFYFVYLLRRYCFHEGFSLPRFTILAIVTGTTLLLPFLPFRNDWRQVLLRLFPFKRGLVHDYWAANVWALWMFLEKCLVVATKKGLGSVSPLHCAILLLIALCPGLFKAWKAASARDNNGLIQAVVYCSLSSFMFAYHVHEKAIMTALLPWTLLDDGLLPAMHWGLLGLFPLLFRPVELLLKLVTYVGYMVLFYDLWDLPFARWDAARALAAGGVIVILEFVPLSWFGRLEFFPLMVTSLSCSVALIGCWLRMLYRIFAVQPTEPPMELNLDT